MFFSGRCIVVDMKGSGEVLTLLRTEDICLLVGWLGVIKFVEASAELGETERDKAAPSPISSTLSRFLSLLVLPILLLRDLSALRAALYFNWTFSGCVLGNTGFDPLLLFRLRERD